MTSAPTLYRLIFKKNCIGEYDVWEQHPCQDKGCLWTPQEFTGRVCLPEEINEFIKEYEFNLVEGIVDEVEVEA